MVEILPVKLLTDEDASIFGALNLSLGKLARLGFPVAPAVVVSPPHLKLKTVLEHFYVLPKAKGKVLQASSKISNTASEEGSYFKSKEVFEQSLTLVKKEVKAIEIPPVMFKEFGRHKRFLVSGQILKSVKELWLLLLDEWIAEVRIRIWKDGFYKRSLKGNFQDELSRFPYKGVTEDLEAKIIILVKKMESTGWAYFDNFGDDTVINVKEGKVNPSDLKRLDEIVREANKKLFIPHQYEWIVDGGVKITKVLPYTPLTVIASEAKQSNNMDKIASSQTPRNDENKSAVKVFLDLSTGLVVEREVDGVYIASEKIFDLNEQSSFASQSRPRDSFDDLVFRLVESASTFPDKPVLFKLADKSEGMGKVRGTLRLLHQQSLFTPMVEALDFVRHKRGLTNMHIVVPFVRGVNEFLQIKRELAVKKLSRKNSLQVWLEVAVPENIINLEEYLVAGLDGVVLNLDELIACLNGFDHTQEDLMFYKNEVGGLIKFLEDGLKLLHKSKIPFIAYGSLSLYPRVLEFLVEKGVYGIVVERYEAPSAHDILHQVEKRLILRRNT